MANMINNHSLVLGVMSGTSLDGLDLACSRYNKLSNKWTFELIAAQTYKYNDAIKNLITKAYNTPHLINEIDFEFTHRVSEYINLFISNLNLDIDLISSHGHTIFHQPEIGLTKQIGSGHIISDLTSIPVVSNFREQDVTLGGQGAPLVPIGDKYLFSEYQSCLNLGGIANISFDILHHRVAFDICPCNLILNFLSQKEGLEYDNLGSLAKTGNVDKKMLIDLNKINFYNERPPKSLGKEYIDLNFKTILNSNIQTQDLLATFVEHIAIQIANVFSNYKLVNCLVTGGGAFNLYLIARIKHYTNAKIVIPNDKIINFKEAIIFGFLGVLRSLNIPNCLSSVTGARMDHCSGDLYSLEC